MSTRSAVFGVLGLALVGSVLLWALFGGAPPPETPVVTNDAAPVQLSADDMRKIGRAPAVAFRNDHQARDLRAAIGIRKDDVDGCLKLLRMHGQHADLDRVEITASYTIRDDGRFDVAVVAPAVADVTFDRCINAVLEPVTVVDDAIEQIELQVPTGE